MVEDVEALEEEDEGEGEGDEGSLAVVGVHLGSSGASASERTGWMDRIKGESMLWTGTSWWKKCIHGKDDRAIAGGIICTVGERQRSGRKLTTSGSV